MEGPVVSMMASVGEQQHEGSSNSSTMLSTSVTGGHGEGARVQKKRKGADATAETKKGRQDRSATWSKEETEKLLQAYPQISQDKGRFRRTSACDESFWVAVSQEVQGRSWKKCQRRMDTLTKSWRAINKKKFTQLDEEMLRRMKLATAMTVDWYNQMCEIKTKPDNTSVVSTETSLVQEGEQSNATSPVFAPGRLYLQTHEPDDSVPHQQDPSHDIMTLQPGKAPNDSSSAGEDEHLHQFPSPPIVLELVPGVQVSAPPAPRSPKPRRDRYSPQPAVEPAAPEPVDLPNDFAAEAVGVSLLGADADLLEDLIDQLDGCDDVDTSSVPPPADSQAPPNPRYREHINRTLDMLRLNRLPGY